MFLTYLAGGLLALGLAIVAAALVVTVMLVVRPVVTVFDTASAGLRDHEVHP